MVKMKALYEQYKEEIDSINEQIKEIKDFQADNIMDEETLSKTNEDIELLRYERDRRQEAVDIMAELLKYGGVIDHHSNKENNDGSRKEQ